MAEQQRERDIAEMEAQMAHDTDQYFEARPQIMRTRDKETTFEAGFKAAWAARPLSHAEGEAVTFMRTWKSEPIYTCNKPGDMGGTYYPAPQVAGLTETAIKSSPAYRALHREKEHLLGLLKDQAPQVAVPEGFTVVPVREFYVMSEDEDIIGGIGNDFEAGKHLLKLAQEGDPEKAWGLVADIDQTKLSAAPTAPAGEPDENDDLVIQADAYRYAYIERLERQLTEPRPDGACPHGVRGVHECQQCADDVPDHIARASVERDIAAMKVRQQPVSDPDGFEQVLEELRKLHTEMTNADLVHEGGPEIVGYCVPGKQLDRMEWLLTCCASAALSSPAPDEREIAALALERHADNLIVMAERDGRNSDRESQQTWEEAAYFAKQEAARLRAGKEGEPS